MVHTEWYLQICLKADEIKPSFSSSFFPSFLLLAVLNGAQWKSDADSFQSRILACSYTRCLLLVTRDVHSRERARSIGSDDRSSWLRISTRSGEKKKKLASSHVANSLQNQLRAHTHTNIVYTHISRDFSHFDQSLAPLIGQLSFEFLPAHVRLSTRVYDFSIDVPDVLG